MTANIVIVSGFLGCLFLHAFGKVVAMEVVMEEKKATTETTTSKVIIDNCYIAIQSGNYETAYTFFIEGINKNDKTLGGVVFETIINGLVIFEYLKSLVIEDYGIPLKSIERLKAIPKDNVICVFEAIHDIAHDRERFLNTRIDECFKQIKAQRNKHK
jgi:hypothetical protein